MEICDWVVQAFPYAVVHRLVENVSSMDSQSTSSRDAISERFGAEPYLLCPHRFCDIRRPRYYWVDWPLVDLPNCGKIQHQGYTELVLVGTSPAESRWLQEGAYRLPEHTNIPFFTFVRAIPRKRPPLDPKGWADCDEAALARWRLDSYRYAPYQYLDQNLVKDGKGLRTLRPAEREARMGYPLGFTAMVKENLLRPHYGCSKDDIRCSLIGNSFCCPVLAWLISHLFVHVDLCERVAHIEECWGVIPETVAAQLGDDLGIDLSLGRRALEVEAVAQLHRNAIFKGSDVRVATSTLVRPDLWPRASIQPHYWTWRIILGYRQDGDHINGLELRAHLTALKWRLRQTSEIGARFVHLLDSQVCISVLCKGRSSSRRLHHVLKRVNALMVASDCLGAYCYIRSEFNPADKPSRWFAKH